MKRSLIIFITLLPVILTNAVAQSLPPVAQAVYDEAYKRDKKRVEYAADNGAAINSTPDGNSFFIQWFPAGSVPATTPVIVTLHGSNGFAFDEFFLWHKQAQLHGCGIIALQWYKGSSAIPPNDYADDKIVYNYIDSALIRIGYPSGKAFLHGFSRGAARTYAVILNDWQSGKNYFCSVLSNAGAANATYPLYADINTGKYGSHVFSGKHWSLYCGGLVPNPKQSGCEGMNVTKNWLEKQGAIIDLFMQSPALGHGGFHQTPAYIDSVLNNYLKCLTPTPQR